VVHAQLKRDGITVSLSSVQRVLARTNLLKKRSLWKRPHDATERPEALYPGALVEVDTIHFLLPDGSRLYVYTLVDLFSRSAYAQAVEKIGTKASVSFLRKARRVAPFAFNMIQTDHGSEFSVWFTHALKTLAIGHRHSRVRHSNDNAHVERFNRTLEEECLDLTAHTIRDFEKALKAYLPKYNGTRLHMGLNFQTPLEVLRRS
jgi:transposase InsO family protein